MKVETMFSSAVKIDQLNDFLNLSEECVLPVGKSGESYEVKLHEKAAPGANKLQLAAADKDTKRIVVGISDCMSCSGCLTSSEEIILKDRGYEDIARKIRQADAAAVSIASQTAFMFAATYNVTYQTAFRKLAYLLKWLGAKRVYDMSLAEAVALHEAKLEFRDTVAASLDAKARIKLQQGGTLEPADVETAMRSGTNAAASGRGTDSDADDGGGDERGQPGMPIIAAHCPGFATYAEKNLDLTVVSHISRVASSQHIQGALVKTLGSFELAAQRSRVPVEPTSGVFNGPYGGLVETLKSVGSYARRRNIEMKPIYHVTTAPCYDKKIEAARSQSDKNLKGIYQHLGLQNESFAGDVKLVDDVLSTGDLQKIMELHNLDFRSMPEADLDRVFSDKHAFLFSKLFEQDVKLPPRHDDSYVRPGSTQAQSGGFAEEIMKFAAQSIVKADEVPSFTETLNHDYQEATLRVGGKPVMTFVLAYGFRNVQNIVQKLKRKAQSGACLMAYIEVMACPGGCFNGAGQVLTPPPADKSYLNNFMKWVRNEGVARSTDKAMRLYHTACRYANTSDREDVKAISSTVIPVLNRLAAVNLIATRVQNQADNATRSAALKW
ncbi:nuclear prelamin A recognition factor-like, putative [Babesia bigemina]|uniref:Nuclear prelamin A recognition factor-like, putative n=1 Tax=Babesia bigemina TaxID=5866 RepID=A0A061D4T2_BABBI|nr:nuclear prelamin A recognition factor-like, putative [Babesia bigemina]CDR95578.1 nuclear prelamin A recognition factor-like, putative [Babesia bigemina]|eukprot:XP_012767764.1 nuclear prelamin A recognition factor-like, putative [Babesia bigemina]